jgi:hypothetical protein
MTYGWAIGYFLVCGLIPCTLVYVSYEKATTYLSLYSPLFLYPLFFGWIAALLMQQAYQRHLSGVLATERKLAFWSGVLVFTVIFFCLEVIGPPAVWEAPPSAVDSDPFLRDFLESTAHSPTDRQQYQVKLGALIGGVQNWHNWPATRWAYFVSALGQASLLLVIFASWPC